MLIRDHKYIFGFLCFTTVVFLLCHGKFSLIYYETIVGVIEYEVPNEPAEDIEEYESFAPNSKCHLPQLKPFDESIMAYVEEPDPLTCISVNVPLLFNKTFDSHLILVEYPPKYGYSNCSYRYVIRENSSDSSMTFSDDTFPITEMSTKIPPEHEFIAVYCSDANSSKIIDMFPFVPLKRKANQDLRPSTNLNFVILGIDAVSHMNLIRTMPKSYKYLTETLKAIGMNGYTKIGDNTFPNVIGALMGKNESEVDDSCRHDAEKYFDECPFIWKNFSESGYLTSYVEESSWMGAFNYGKSGFKYPPTDYYTRPFFYAADDFVGTQQLDNSKVCYGPRMSFEILLNYVQQTAVTMQSSHQYYFQFVWAASLFHDRLNEGKVGDETLLNTLTMFKSENYLNNTVFILMSDHGIRWGSIVDTYQGKVEERMPFLYFVLPESILNNPVYKNALRNLRENKQRLTTPYDLHETLKDFLNLTHIENDSVSSRCEKLREINNLRGISLFLPIPPERDCDMAGIEEHWCVCHSRKNIPVENNMVVSEATEFVINNINERLNETENECAKLGLLKILTSEEVEVDNSELKDSSELTLGVHFLTSPGNGSFEATVKRLLKNDVFSWSILGDISRTNIYGNQSYCVNNLHFKKFCYCL